MKARNPAGKSGPGKNFGGDSGGDAPESRSDESGSPRGSGKFSGKLWAAGFLAVLAVLAAAVAATDYLVNSGSIYRGVEVGDVDLGGLSRSQAEQTLSERIPNELQEIQFRGPEESFTVPAREFGVNFNVPATVDAAYAVGREGNILEQVKERFAATFGTVEVPTEAGYESEVARSAVESLAQRINEEPQTGYVRINGAGVEVGEARSGYEVDVAGTVDNLDRSVDELSGDVEVAGQELEPAVSTAAAREAGDKARAALDGPLVLKEGGQEWRISPQQIGEALQLRARDGNIQVSFVESRLRGVVNGIASEINAEPRSAQYVVSGPQVLVQDGQIGKTVEAQKLLGAIGAGMFTGQREYQVPVITEEPAFTTAEAESLRPTELIGDYRTTFAVEDANSPERVANLQIASNAINGTLVAPGEVFSANEILAPLDYNAAHVFSGGKVATADGGGLCQIASTLYMAANWAGLDILERHQHYAKLNYIRPGFDSTLWFGRSGGQELDMQFRNTTSGYLLVREYVSNGYVYAEIYGQPTGKSVDMYSEKVGSGEDTETWTTYKTVTDASSGEVLQSGPLHTDTYKAIEKEDGEKVKPSEVPAAPIDP